jgi:hypothetical protein
MEKIYSEEKSVGRSFKAKPETIKFLMDFSRSFHAVHYGKFKFETNLN